MTEEVVERNARCNIIHVLKRLQGEQDVIVRTVGLFQFDLGRLVRVEDCMVVGTDVEVYLPSGDTIEVGNVTINLCAITSIGIDARETR